MIYSCRFSIPPVNLPCNSQSPFLNLLPSSLPCLPSAESGQYDIRAGQGEPNALRASRALRPPAGSQSPSLGDHTAAVGSHRHRSGSDETHLVRPTGRTGTKALFDFTKAAFALHGPSDTIPICWLPSGTVGMRVMTLDGEKQMYGILLF